MKPITLSSLLGCSDGNPAHARFARATISARYPIPTATLMNIPREKGGELLRAISRSLWYRDSEEFQDLYYWLH